MIVSEIMRWRVATCAAQDVLATAAKIMREHRCGFLPVVDSHGTVAGVLTDRDVCLNAADMSRSMAHTTVKDAMSHPVFGCPSDANVKTALTTMARHHVRRLVVLDAHGHLHGVVSIDDVIQAPHRLGAPTAEEIVAALTGISTTQPIETVSV
jgi:CBS domain-containing protein